MFYHLIWVGILSIFRIFFFQAEDGIRDLVRSRGLGDVYKRQTLTDQVSRNDQTLDLASPLADGHQPRVAVHALDLSLIHI